MNRKTSQDDFKRIRLSLCMKDPHKAATLCERLRQMQGVSSLRADGTPERWESPGIVFMKAIWDQPQATWAADVLILDAEDMELFRKMAVLPFYPAILLYNEKGQSPERVVEVLGRVPFATFSGSVSSQELQQLVWYAAAHTRMLLAGWHSDYAQEISTQKITPPTPSYKEGEEKEGLPAPAKEILRKQQLEIIGRMAMRSSHELKNCLVSIRTFTQLFPEKYAEEQFRKDFYQVVSKEVERLNGLVEKLLFFAQPVQLKLSEEKISDLINEAFTLFATEDLQNVQLHKAFGHKQPTLWVDRQQMLAVFFHVIQNSLHATSNSGRLMIVTEDHPHPDIADGVLAIRFLDTGRGMNVKDLEEPFEPFFSTKARGLGLGLTIAKRIVEEHGGTIRLSSQKDRGTEVIVCLPRRVPNWQAQDLKENDAPKANPAVWPSEAE